MLVNSTSPVVSVSNVTVDKVNTEIQEVTNVMRNNISIAMQNLESSSVIADRAEELASNANRFTITARGIRRTMWWRNLKYGLCCGVVIFVLAGGGVLLANSSVYKPSTISDTP